ncbi:insulinase family protein [candidate division GN15 bacterium]|nr:insulinase family protein [candidate division GN15 bacterium]
MNERVQRLTVLTGLLCVLLTLACPTTNAGQLPELKIEKYELPNGLDVILHEDHTIPVVSVNVWYHVGSKNETPGRTGFAHLFEHLMFEGSEHHNKKFTESINKYGGTRNGSTNADRTNYWEKMPSNYLEKTLWLEADRMANLLPAIDQERLDLQRSVVKNEKRQNADDQPYGMVNEFTRRTIYPPSHPYSWTTIGLMEDLDAASLEDVKNFNRKYYRPNNASLCIAGDFDPAEAKAWVEKYFGIIPPGPPVERLDKWVPRLEKEIRAVMTDEVNLPRLYMVWHTPPYYHPGDAEFDLFASVLSAGKSSRLYKELVYEKQIAQDVTAYQASREIGSTFHIIATAKPGHTLEELESQVIRILDDVLTNAITEEELARVKVNWEAGFVRALENIGGFGGRADALNSYNTFLGDPNMFAWDQQRYTKPTTKSVLGYARSYLTDDSRFVLYVHPQGQLAAVDAGTDMAVEPGSQAERAFTAPEVQKTTLSNGMELLVIENRKLPLVQVNLVIKSGWAADPTDRPGASSLTADLLNEGTKSRSALEISEASQRLGINLGIASGFDNTDINLNALKDQLDPALALVSDIVLHPTFPEDELTRLKQNYLGQIQQQKAQPFTVAFKAFLRDLYGDSHPYAQPYTGTGTEESIAAITRQDIVDYYKANYRPNNTVAVVVGDISLEIARDKLEQAFREWQPGEVTSHQVALVEPSSKPRVCIIDQPGTSQSTIVLGNLTTPRNAPSYHQSQLVTQVLGGGPSGRLYRNLREDKGYTYGSYCFTTSRVGQGAFVAYAQVQTDVTKDALAEFVREIRGIRGDIPMTDEELNDHRNTLVKGFPQNFETIGGVAGQLADNVTYSLPLDTWQTYVDRLNSVSVDDALSAAEKYIKPDELLIVVVGDREKIEPGIRELGLGEVYFGNAM